MKSARTAHHDEPDNTKFPCLMITKDLEVVALVTGIRQHTARNLYDGVVVHSNRHIDKIGQCLDTWHREVFKQYNGTVQLEND